MQKSALVGTQGYTGNSAGWNHIARFVYALKSPETRRQYPQRLKVFLDFLDTGSTKLDEQALQLLLNVKEDPRWFEDRFMDFIGFQLERVPRGEISESTIPNYYKATKLFLEMNDAATSINWKKICRGIPKGKQGSKRQGTSQRRNSEIGRVS